MFKDQVRLKGCRVRVSSGIGKPYSTPTSKTVKVAVPTENVKEFLDEIEDTYWLNLEEFGHSDLPVGNPDRFDINFNTYSFSDLTKLYLVLKNNTGKFNVSHCDELLNAVATTLGGYMKHVSRRIKRKVLRVLNDPLFHDLKGSIIAGTPPDSQTGPRRIK